MQRIAVRYAINTVSVYDWLTGIPNGVFDVPPLCDLPALQSPQLVEAVRPYVGTLKLQYRMHASLSRVPRELFYFGEALHDGKETADREHRVGFMQVDGSGSRGEENEAECEKICAALKNLAGSGSGADDAGSFMVITPYKDQRHLLLDAIDRAREAGEIGSLTVDVLTLDSCQGREAEYVFISLVRGRASPFLDMPNRWNVALTRAKTAMFLVGDINSYLQEARRAGADPRRSDPQRGRQEVRMSLLARIIDSYDRQINGH